MNDRPTPPAAQHLAEAALNLPPRHGDGMYLLTFTAPAGAVEYDIANLGIHTIAEYGLPTVLYAFAYGFARRRHSGLYDRVVGYGVHDTTADVTICADRFGCLAITAPRPDDATRHAVALEINAAVAEALLAMVVAGPGIVTTPPPGDIDTTTATSPITETTAPARHHGQANTREHPTAEQ